MSKVSLSKRFKNFQPFSGVVERITVVTEEDIAAFLKSIAACSRGGRSSGVS